VCMLILAAGGRTTSWGSCLEQSQRRRPRAWHARNFQSILIGTPSIKQAAEKENGRDRDIQRN